MGSRRGARALGIGGGSLAVLFGGGLGGASVAAITPAAAGLAVRASGGLPGGESEAHFLVVMQDQGRYKGLLQTLPTSVAGIVMHYDDVIEVRQVISPRISAEGAERELHQFTSKIDWEAL